MIKSTEVSDLNHSATGAANKNFDKTLINDKHLKKKYQITGLIFVDRYGIQNLKYLYNVLMQEYTKSNTAFPHTSFV